MIKKAENLDLWNSVCVTNPNDTKKFKGSGGFQGTAICAQSQRMRATEVFGPFGMGWGVDPETEQFDFREIGDVTLLIYRAVLWYNSDSGRCLIPISSSIKACYKTHQGYLRTDDNCMKKAQTDAMTKGLSTLGFNADVFLGLFDDSAYVNSLNEQEAIEKANLMTSGKYKGKHWNKAVADEDYMQELLSNNVIAIIEKNETRTPAQNAVLAKLKSMTVEA